MAIEIYFKLFSKVGLKRIWSSFVSFFGLAGLLTKPVSLFFPGRPDFGWTGYFALIIICFIFAILKCFPRRSFCHKLSSPDSMVEVKVGDIFDEKGHIVIGTNDVFDTELGEIIKPSSVQGQFLTKVYANDIARLDADIETALEPLSNLCKEETNKKRGKTGRYPIGTAITLGTHDKRYFLTAYGYMNNDITVQSSSEYILQSLNNLWKEIRLKGHSENVTIPIIGSDLARTGLPRMALAKLIIEAFVIASKEKFITKKLTVMIYPKDLDSIDLYKLEDFLESACF
ncbi:DUF6430 domain-containing protein [Nostoc sp. CHAB 5784]|uniref:macro domain-containing protein n=1 Tax=Nostoc mirabile TaxID=2907820 RepID=UPI001E3B11DE|nr:macro domain-containing protein [Nostoc mirabile]MCC5670130.1 DUF6430 domain-containing protein [Nostoc mirabile CHAB5784]